ncbi:hypothetical protein ACPPVT_15375 [Angustibacter sp. McL0619]|uniref:hypothetical protein n=1 Tax=Angustibacter sp. McL0619 TaxID=3415676 RepID=UPI003CF319B5
MSFGFLVASATTPPVVHVTVGGGGWPQTLLDGLIGGVIGGAVTAAGVWLALRHERQLATEARSFDAVRAGMAEISKWMMFFQVTKDPMPAMEEWIADLVGHIAVIEAIAHTTAPKLDSMVRSAEQELYGATKSGSKERVTQALATLGHVLETWLTDPAAFQRAPQDFQVYLSRIRAL